MLEPCHSNHRSAQFCSSYAGLQAVSNIQPSCQPVLAFFKQRMAGTVEPICVYLSRPINEKLLCLMLLYQAIVAAGPHILPRFLRTCRHASPFDPAGSRKLLI